MEKKYTCRAVTISLKPVQLFLYCTSFWLLAGCAATRKPESAGQDQYKNSVRTLVAQKFPRGNVFIGAATHYALFGTETIELLDREFSYVTPANDFKQTRVHPRPGAWDWKAADAWIAHARKHGQVLRLHAPISPQCSKWVKDDARTADELALMLDEYLTALCLKYNGVPNIQWLDVVNETIDKKNGDWFGPKPGTDKWENPWPQMGFDENHELRPPIYIKKAFEIANRHATSMQLIINQHGALEPYVWEKMKALVGYLRESGLRVDGLGWQAHIDVGWENIPGNIKRLQDLIRWCHRNELEFHITEFNVWLKGKNEGDHTAQAETFTAISKVLLDGAATGTVGLNYWQIRGSETPHPEWDGCVFDEQLRPKPAYGQLVGLLQQY